MTTGAPQPAPTYDVPERSLPYLLAMLVPSLIVFVLAALALVCCSVGGLIFGAGDSHREVAVKTVTGAVLIGAAAFVAWLALS